MDRQPWDGMTEARRIRNCDGLQLFAILKGIFANQLHAAVHGNGSQGCAAGKGIHLNAGDSDPRLMVFFGLISLLLFYTHRANIGRLLHGSENKTYLFGHKNRVTQK